MTAAAPVVLGSLREKDFIASVLGRFATTAREHEFEDCMVVPVGDEVVVLNVDHPSYIRGRFRSLDDYRFYGRWAAAGTCGDVISMGVRPSGFAVDLSAPPSMQVDAVQAIYEGISDVLQTYGATLMGGNLDSGPLEIVGVAWGVGTPGRLVRRSGARPGDRIVVTCDLGVGWAGYLMNHHDLRERVPRHLVIEADGYSDRAQVAAEPILECAAAGYFTSGMDLSDGLIEFCTTIARRNDGVGVCLDESLLGDHPLLRSVGELLGIRPGLLALDPGYDFPYAHGYTVRDDDLEAVLDVFKRHDATCRAVGFVTEGGDTVLQSGGGLVALPEFWSDQLESRSAVDIWSEVVAGL